MEQQILYDNGHVALLWRDENGDLTEGIKRARAYFEERTHSQETSVRINPDSFLGVKVEEVAEIRFDLAEEILPGYFLFIRGGEA